MVKIWETTLAEQGPFPSWNDRINEVVARGPDALRFKRNSLLGRASTSLSTSLTRYFDADFCRMRDSTFGKRKLSRLESSQ